VTGTVPAAAPNGRVRRIVIVLLVLVAAAVTVVVLVQRSSAQAGGVVDDEASGRIVLYDRSGHPITHGSVTDRPFVWRAASTVPAPAGYGLGAKATLLAFQPREGVGPAAWSGDTLTASAPITDPDHPAATATARDFSLKDFLDEFPPRWDGRIELRLYLAGPGAPVRSSGYPAVMLRISGDTWSVVAR
jgi:hypothetical protein